MHVAGSYSDTGLLNGLKNPREIDNSIKNIYQQYYRSLETYVVNNNGTKDDAADTIQEAIVVFIEMVQQDKFRGDASIHSLLYSITKNLWLTELRKRTSTERRNNVFEKAKDITEEATVKHLTHREHYGAIMKVFDLLGEKCKQLLMLVYYEDMQMIDVMKKMPEYQSEQAVRNKKYKCMKQLDELIKQNETLRITLKNALNYAG